MDESDKPKVTVTPNPYPVGCAPLCVQCYNARAYIDPKSGSLIVEKPWDTGNRLSISEEEARDFVQGLCQLVGVGQ